MGHGGQDACNAHVHWIWPCHAACPIYMADEAGDVFIWVIKGRMLLEMNQHLGEIAWFSVAEALCFHAASIGIVI